MNSRLKQLLEKLPTRVRTVAVHSTDQLNNMIQDLESQQASEERKRDSLNNETTIQIELDDAVATLVGF